MPAGNVEFVTQEENRKGVPVVNLFREGRGLGTVMLWIINFMNLLNLYFLGSWLPTVVKDAGYTTAIAVLVGTAVQVGGSLGTIPNGWMIDRYGFRKVLTIVFGVATISIAMIGQPSLPLSMLFFASFMAGWCVPGGQPGVNSLAALYYPTYFGRPVSAPVWDSDASERLWDRSLLERCSAMAGRTANCSWRPPSPP